MSVGGTTTPRVSQLADRLLADIETRDLKPGDRFLTTIEAAKLLGVGSAAANRALQLLERRRVIVRQQRSGAFIAGRPATEKKPKLHRVHFQVHQTYLRTEGVGQDQLLLGLEHELPGVPVQISFLPVGNEAAFVKELVDESTRADRVDGFVLVRASYETQRLLSEQPIPTVVYGTIYPSVKGLASLTADMYATGCELAKHLLSRGHQRIAYMGRQVVFGGDQLTIEGITATMQEAGLGLENFAQRMLPGFDEVYQAGVEQLMDGPYRITGFVCRTVRMADAVGRVAEARGLQLGRDVDVAICEYYLKPGSRPRYAYSKPAISSEEQGRHLAKLLIAQVENKGDIRHEVMPVHLEFPLVRSR